MVVGAWPADGCWWWWCFAVPLQCYKCSEVTWGPLDVYCTEETEVCKSSAEVHTHSLFHCGTLKWKKTFCSWYSLVPATLFSFFLSVFLFDCFSFLFCEVNLLKKKKKKKASHVFHLLTRLHARTPPPPTHTHSHVCTHAPSPTPTPHTHTETEKGSIYTWGKCNELIAVGHCIYTLLWDTAFTLCCIYTLLWDTAFTLCCGTLHLHFAVGHCIYTLLHLHFTGGHCHLYFAVAVGHCIYTLLWDTAFRLLAVGHCISTCLWDAAFTLFCGTMHLHFAVGQCIYMLLSLR